MNVSWDDLNNVREAGDYPFRDGTITVTFAEVATWKKNPDAKFQLMRKHAVQGAHKYVLGKQIEEQSVPSDGELIYESSNGDSWRLTRDPQTGARAVMHRPNPQSGGQVSYIEIEKFLSEGANDPEHQALRRLLEASAPMATVLIAYDIHPPEGEAYENLTEKIRSLGTWWHHLETTWIVKSVHAPDEIRDQLSAYVGSDDQVLVVDISGDTAEWLGVNDTGSKWLKEAI
jgi:hypothetical protein